MTDKLDHLPTKGDITLMARNLAGALKDQHRLRIKHGQAMTLVARQHGFGTADALVAAVERAPQRTLPDAVRNVLQDLEGRFARMRTEVLCGLGLDESFSNLRSLLGVSAGPAVPRSDGLARVDRGARSGDTVVDLVGDLGVGRVLEVYTNRSDTPMGETLAVVAFEDGTTADRGLHEVAVIEPHGGATEEQRWRINVRAIVRADDNFFDDYVLPDAWEEYDRDRQDAETVLRCDTQVEISATDRAAAIEAATDRAPGLGIASSDAEVALWVDESIDVELIDASEAADVVAHPAGCSAVASINIDALPLRHRGVRIVEVSSAEYDHNGAIVRAEDGTELFSDLAPDWACRALDQNFASCRDHVRTLRGSEVAGLMAAMEAEGAVTDGNRPALWALLNSYIGAEVPVDRLDGATGGGAVG